ncbi:MAG: VWA domain-containing protein [Pseudomonadota bacterium]
MSFGAPGILLGLLLLGLPLWLHRLRTDSARSEPFSSVRLLEAATQRVFVDRRIRYWLLLALRLLLLALAVLLFARPQLRASAGAGEDETIHWVVLDLSASMQRAALDDAVSETIERVLAAIPDDQPVGLLAAQGGLQVAVPLGQARGTISTAAGRLEPGAGRLDFGEVVSSLGDFLDRNAANAVVHLISDFQASALPSQFSLLVPRAPYQLQLHPVVGATDNTWISAASVSDEVLTAQLVGGDGFGEVLVQVGDEPPLRVTSDPTSGLLRAELDLLPQENLIKLSLDDGATTMDNQFNLLVDRSPKEQVPLLSAGPASGAEEANPYLSAALTAVSTRAELTPVASAEFDARRLSRHRWLVIEDLGSISGGLARALESWVQGGGRVLAGAAAASQGLRRLPLTGHELADTDLALADGQSPADPQAVTGVAVGHPLIDRRLSFRDIRVSQLLPLETLEADQPLLWLAGGQPLVLEHRLGDGLVLLVNGGFDRRFNDWPTKASFVPFVGVVADYLAGHRTLERQRVAGTLLALPEREGVSYELVAPSAAGDLFGQRLDRSGVRLDQTGFYALHGSDGTVRHIAVNVDPRESDLVALDEATISRWRDALTQRGLRSAQPVDAVSDEPTDNRLAIWLLCALAALVLAESLLGNYTMRKPA